MFKEVNTILSSHYGISNVFSIMFLKREDLDYSVLLSRKVLIINNNYILKIFFDDKSSDLDYIFKFLKKYSCDNIIYPILTLEKNSIVKNKNINYLLFKKFKLLKNLNFDSIILDYFNFIVLLNKMDKTKIQNSNSYDISMLKLLKNKSFFILLEKLSIDYSDFKYHLNLYLKNKKVGVIYGTFWEGNIYYLDSRNIFLDIDSIRRGDPFYDMCFVLLYVFIKKDKNKRYYFYEKIFNFYINNFGIIDKTYLKGLLYYFCFFIFKEIKDRKANIILNHIFINVKFMKDFLNFYIYKYDI